MPPEPIAVQVAASTPSSGNGPNESVIIEPSGLFGIGVISVAEKGDGDPESVREKKKEQTAAVDVVFMLASFRLVAFLCALRNEHIISRMGVPCP